MFGALLLAVSAGCTSGPRSSEDPPPVSLSAKEASEAAYVAGLEFALEGRHAEALVLFHQAVAQDPLQAEAHYRSGLCYYHLGEYELEAAEYRKALAIRPQMGKAWRALALSCLSADDLQGARTAYREALVLEPRNATVVYNLGLVEADLGQTEEARRLFERCASEGEARLRERARQRLEVLRSGR